MPARKSLGQYYLVDTSVIDHILSAAEVGPQDTVVEIGPGTGALTRELIRRARRVIAIEIDSHLAASLRTALGNPANLEVTNADARDVDLTAVLEDTTDYKMVGNLPYYAANPIIRRYLEGDQPRPSLIVVMVQKEVASRMVAEGNRMSLLGVGIQLYGIARIICDVPSQAFDPKPKVTSTVVRIDLRPHPAIDVESEEEFFNTVRAGFFAPRKQLHNSLSLGLGFPAELTSRILIEAGLDPRRRAETLSLDEWGDLYRAAKGTHGRGS